MLRAPRHPSPRVSAGVSFGLLVVVLLAAGLAPPGPTATAQPAAGIPAELQYVPPDAAFFVHVDTAKFWAGPIGKAARDADKKATEELLANATKAFGISPDELRTLTAFWPRFKGPGDEKRFGLVLAFKTAYDKDKLKAGIDSLRFPPPVAVHTPTDKVAVVLAGFPADAKPKPAAADGPLTPAIREAASGTHLVVAASNLANLPDEIRDANVLPQDVRPFLPLFQADTITGFIDLDKELSVEVRVKSATAPRAAEAEKALGLLVTLMREGLDQLPKELGKDAASDPALKNTFAFLTAAQVGLKGARFSTTGTESRARVAVPADLPFGPALAEATTKVREAAARARSSNNLKQIALAMHGYNDTHGVMPPAAVVDKRGKPLLSWRVLILPYVEQEQLYRQFKLDEPWDSENNKKLLDKMPPVYALPTPTPAKAKANETHYQAFVGNGAAFDLLQGAKLVAIPDGTSNTLMVATAADPVPWTKPDDIAYDPDQDMTKKLGFFHSGVCQVAFCDGSVRSLSKSIAPKTLHAMITRAGGEVVNDE